MIDLTKERLLNPKPGYVFTHYTNRSHFTVVQVRGQHVVIEINYQMGPEEPVEVKRYSNPTALEEDFRFVGAPGHTYEYAHDRGNYRHWPQGLKGRMDDIIQENEEVKFGV